jgi:hypothetical protein
MAKSPTSEQYISFGRSGKPPQSRFVLIRYSVDAKEEPYGLRLDLDKKAILDDVGDAATARAVKECAQDIWKIVVDVRFRRG